MQSCSQATGENDIEEGLVLFVLRPVHYSKTWPKPPSPRRASGIRVRRKHIQCSQTRGENDIEMGSILFEVGEIILVFLE